MIVNVTEICKIWRAQGWQWRDNCNLAATTGMFTDLLIIVIHYLMAC